MNEADRLQLTDDEIRSRAEDLAEDSDFVSLAGDAPVLRSEDGQTARVAAWVMVECGRVEEPKTLC